MTLLTFSFLLMTPSQDSEIPGELRAYVSRRDDSFSWRAAGKKRDLEELRLTSQTWKGIRWKHDLTLLSPGSSGHQDTALLIITGDRTAADMEEARRLAEKASMPVATLFNVPNQPLWDLREDALIAHSFVKYLETGEKDWPLLFPMTKAAIRAMDVLQKYRPQIKNFVVTGMSKRGWTTWMVGALGDKRVAGIAPMIYDNLNIPAQLARQLELWGKYSDMIDDYTKAGLQETLGTPEGKRLALIVDPFSYRLKVKAPTLVIRGSNDPYWSVDATAQYWDELKQPKWLLTLPNAGHGPGDGSLYFETLGAFARSCAGEFAMPKFSATVWSQHSPDREGGIPASGSAVVEVTKGSVKGIKVWHTHGTLDHRFDHAVWRPVVEANGEQLKVGKNVFTFPLSPTDLSGLFVECRFAVKGGTLTLSYPTSMHFPY